MELKGNLQADLGSALPTSGGLYWWTHFFSSPATRDPLGFLVGYSNSIGLIGGFCGVDCLSLQVFCFAKFHDNHVPVFAIAPLLLKPAVISVCFGAGNS